MEHDFVMCVREVKNKQFIPEPGKSRFLLVPEGELPSPTQAVGAAKWVKELNEEATWGTDVRRGADQPRARGDILIFVHGYNNSQEIVMQRHRRLKADLRAAGYKGAVMSFDWPSADATLNYLEDRHDAKKTALQLVSGGIRLLAKQQRPDCAIKISLLGHSTGAYVIREAFDDADDAELMNNAWMISQIAFVGGDVSSASMGLNRSRSRSVFEHCVRFTNYSNRHDYVLKIPNAKRVGMAPRVGRVGLPESVSNKAINVDCSAYFKQLKADANIQAEDQRQEIGTFEHSWHIGNRIFTEDLFETIKGDRDRQTFLTRGADDEGNLVLTRKG